MSEMKTARLDRETVRRRMSELQAAFERSAEVSEARLLEIRHERAVRLASRRSDLPAATDVFPVLVFQLGAESYGIELKSIVRIFPQTIVTPLPGASPALLGIANLQGEVRSVLDLRRLSALSVGDAAADGYVLLLRHDGGFVGLYVEQLGGVRHFAPAELTAPDPELNERYLRGVQAVTPDKVIVLDVAALLDTASTSLPESKSK